MNKMDRIKVDDLQLRPEVFALRLQRRAKLRDAINAGMKSIDQAVADYKLNEYYDRALSLVVSGRARDAFNLQAESDKTRDLYGRTTFGQSCLLARRLVEAGTAALPVSATGRAMADSLTRFARGLGMARSGDLAGAKREIQALQELRAALEQSGQSYWADRSEEQILAVSAWVALAEGSARASGEAHASRRRRRGRQRQARGDGEPPVSDARAAR